MLSKNNRQLINRMNAKQRQRFGLRKLTVGVASVLLGTTFFFGGVASADTVSAPNNAATVPSIDQTTTVQATTSTNTSKDNGQQSQQVTLKKATNSQSTARVAQTGANDETQPMQVTTSAQQPLSAAELRQSNVNPYDSTEPVFSGTVNWNPQSDYHVGDTDEISYVLQTGPGTNSGRSVTYDRASKYLLVIPSGFDASLNDFTIVGGNDSRYQFDLSKVQDLGMVGSHGEHVFLLPLAQPPSYAVPLVIKVKITDNGNNGGHHSYGGWSSDQLLLGVNQNLLPDFGGFGGQTFTYHLGDHTYTAYSSTIAFNSRQLGTAEYTAIPGNQQLSNNNYKVIAVNPSKASRQGNQLSYEGIAPQIHLTGTVNDGDYIDFHLGIPYKDQQGQQQFLPYDSTLAPSFDVTEQGTVIGRVYNMGNYYRLVFNANVQNFQNPTLQVNLKWAGNGDNPSINDNHYIYRKTDNVAQNDQEFTYKPTDDVNINGQQSASGFTVKGLYLSERPATDNVNVYSGSGITPSTVRTWDNEGHVGINTDWTEGFNFTVNTKQASNKFALDIRVAKNPQLHYYWETDASLADQIKNVLAPLTTHHLSNATVADSSIFVTDNPVRGEKPQVDVKVTHEDLNDTPNGYHRIYHVVIADPTVNMNYGFRVLTTAAPNFTMPAGITSYEQDKEQSVAANHEGTYNNSNPNQVTAALTGNTALNDSFKAAHIPFGGGTAAAVMAVKNDTTNQEASEWGGAAWEADVALKTNGTVEGGGSASDIVTATVHIKDADTQDDLTPDGVMSQGATGSDIKFKGLQRVYDGLSDYHFVKAVSVKNGQETAIPQPDLTKLDSDTFGIANKNNPTEFIIYVRKANQQTITVNYIDDVNGKTLHTDTLTGVSNADADYTTKSTINGYLKQHYLLVSDDTNGHALTFDHDDKVDQLYNVHFKHAIRSASDTKTVKETINYVYDGGAKAANSRTAQIEFNRTGTTDLVTGDTSWNAWTPTKSQLNAVNSPIITGYTPDQARIGAITVDPTSEDITRTVTYIANDQTATIKYIDDTTGKTLKTDTANGKFGQAIVFNVDPDRQINDYQDLHYVLVSNSFDANKYQADDQQNQFEVHFKHATQSASDTRTITETIHYVYADGSKAADSKTAQVEFDRTGTTDLVTNQTQWNAWTPAKGQLNAVDSPAIEGYTPDIAVVEATTVDPSSQNINKTVTYHADKQTITVNYIDDVTGKTLHTDTLTGVSNADANYTTKSTINGYLDQHYLLVSDDTNGQALIFDHDDKVDQVYNVHLTHATQPTSDQKTISETIHYVYPDGHQSAADYQAAPITFTRAGTQDLVTGIVQWNEWTPTKQVFDSVVSPKIDGYTADRLIVGPVTVSHDSHDVKVVVHYQANTAKPDKPVQPGTPNKQTPNESIPGTNVVPGSPKPTVVSTSQNPAKQPEQHRSQTLPQTGHNDSEAIAGLGIATLIGMFGMGLSKKKREK